MPQVTDIAFRGELLGDDKLAKQLAYLANGALTVEILRPTVKKAMEIAYDRAQALIPVSAEKHKSYLGHELPPGFAKASIRIITRQRSDKQAVTAVMGVRKEAYYAVQFVEVGTSKQQAQPWLRPAFASTASAQADSVADDFKTRVLKVRQIVDV